MEKYINQCKYLENYDSVYNRKEKKWELYNADILTLDTETTSCWYNDITGEITGYVPGKPEEYWTDKHMHPFAFVYIWMFSINEKVYYGRDWREFETVLKDLDKTKHYIIYIHNLSFEFEFMRNIFEFENKDVFARSPHKVMKATPKKYKNVEFRCSYFLSNLSLESVGKQLGLPKKVGDLDYEKIRTPLTPLTKTELGYCERDCEVVYEYIKKQREKYGNLKNIPLTLTGGIRREVKNLLYSQEGYETKIKSLVPQNAVIYDINRNSFAGGLSHGNPLYAGIVQKGLITHWDFISAYIATMLAKKFPMTPWVQVIPACEPSEEDMKKNAYIIKARFYGIKSIKYNNFIACSKSAIKKGVRDNGRLIKAEECYVCVTEQDWITIKECYKCDRVEIEEVWKSKKAYLPKTFVEYILDLYENKTKLKDVPGQEDLYQNSKGCLNSLFGMSVTNIIQADVDFDAGEWNVIPLTEEYVNAKLAKMKIVDGGQTRDYFLNYSWGVWISAYSRRELINCILQYDDRVLYYDTDSIFMLGEGDFSEYNKRITKELEEMCKYYNIDPERTRPETIKGEKKQLGLFEKEPDCCEFVTLGAKRYCYRLIKDGKLYITVAGINKEAVDCLDNNIKNFKVGVTFDKDHPSVHKTLRTYCDNQKEVVMNDGWKMNYKYGINLRRTGYKLTIDDDYDFICKKDGFIKLLIQEDICDQIPISMRGEFYE